MRGGRPDRSADHGSPDPARRRDPRASDPQLPKTPLAIVASLLDSLCQLAHLAWRAPERVARTYSPSQTFAVGELVEHPKFGRGTVVACKAQRVDVEFPDGVITLVHMRPSS